MDADGVYSPKRWLEIRKAMNKVEEIRLMGDPQNPSERYLSLTEGKEYQDAYAKIPSELLEEFEKDMQELERRKHGVDRLILFT